SRLRRRCVLVRARHRSRRDRPSGGGEYVNHGLGREARQFYQDVPGNLTIHATKGEWDEVANQNKSNKLIATLRRMVHRVAPNVEVVIATIAVLASLVTVFVAGARWYRTGKVLPAGR